MANLILTGFYHSGGSYVTYHSSYEDLNEEVRAIKSLDNFNHRGIYGDDKTVNKDTLRINFISGSK